MAIVGGGPAGAALAMRLAGAGRDVVLLERAPRYRWRACGVFSSPAAIGELFALGLTQADLARVARPIPRLWVAAPGGAEFPLDYGRGDTSDPTAVGFDRSALDPLLLERAGASGADVREGTSVTGVDLAPGTERRGGRLTLAGTDGRWTLTARLIIGADGIRSVVARAAGVVRPARLPPRIGLTYHVPEAISAGGDAVDGRMIVVRGGYCGLAPVPGGRVNVGIVLWGRQRRAALVRLGAAAATAALVDSLPAWPAGHGPELESNRLDDIAGAAPIAHRVSRRAGPTWLLVGDAAGFLDPFTGEGLHRAFVSARLAAAAIGTGRHAGDGTVGGPAGGAAAYEQAMRAQFAAKDLVSWIVQVVVARPGLFDHVATRLAHRTDLREQMGRVMGDVAPARDAFDPRFLAALIAP